MDIVLASNNAHKAIELAAGLPAALNIVPVGEFSDVAPEETGSTFVENAIIKARHACLVSKLPGVADDSGLVVPSLEGNPGVRSARYAGEDPTDIENLLHLLKEMSDITDRQATFVCVLVWLRHATDPLPIIAEGLMTGTIATKPSGNNGFGYDPVFVPTGYSVTCATLEAAQKQQISHRARALQTLGKRLRDEYSALL